jgi:purine-binding chemotaxis protein CheW
MAMNANDHSRQVVVFSLGGEQYALPIAAVSEIIRYTPPRSILSQDPYTQGVIGLRGKIVPVYDLAARIGVPASAAGKIIIVDDHGHPVGVTVDEVDEVLTLTGDQLESAPGADRSAIDTIAKVDDRLIILLEPAGLFGFAEAELPIS